MPEKFLGYKCSICGESFSPSQVTYICPKDGGNLDVVLDLDQINKHTSPKQIQASTEPSLWRYLPLLPVQDPGAYGTPFRAAGNTPIFESSRLAEKLNIQKIWIKDEGKNPSASFKDRASAIVVARAREISAKMVVTASTGNAGAALACMATSVGQPATIFAPKSAPPAKIAQLLVFGARVILVDGNYDSAFDLTIEASQQFGWYCRNTGYNPFTVEGKKTAAFEIWEKMLIGSPTSKKPLAIFVSVGDGNIISGIHKGFKDLAELGWLEQIPRIYGVQSEGSAAIANAFEAGNEEILPVIATTVADSISVDFPRDGVRAVRAARETGGKYLKVTDQAIIDAIAELGKVGIFAEPAGSAAYAGLLKAIEIGEIGSDDQVLVINTGSGLKDVRSAMQAVTEPVVIQPDLIELKKVLERWHE